MDSSCTTLLQCTNPYFFPLKPAPTDKTKARPTSIIVPCKNSDVNRDYRSVRVNCHKMYVPGNGDASPEAKAADHLHKFFTYIAVKIVNAQLQSYNRGAHKDLNDFLATHPLNDGDKFCADLMRESSHHKSLALRILEVRSAYCKNDFEWDNLKKLTSKLMDESNTRLMREYVTDTSRVDGLQNHPF